MTTPTQGEHAQTEALRLADDLEASSLFPGNMRSCNNAAAAELRRLHAKVTALTAALGVQAEPVKDEATCQMCGEKPYPGCNSEFQDEAACRFYHPVTAQTALAHELFAAAQLAPGEGIEDAVSRIAAALTAATAQPAAPQCVAYAELDDAFESWLEDQDVDRLSDGYESWLNSVRSCWDSALRASHGQAPAGAADEMEINRPFEDPAPPFNQWRGEMQSALKRAGVYAARSPGAGNKLTLRWRTTREDVLPTPTAQAAPAAGAVVGPVDDIDAIALARYKVVPAHESMFHRFAVVAGDGKQQLYLGRETECQNMARKFAGAFLDGAFHQSQIAAAPTSVAQADSVPQKETPDETLWQWYLANKGVEIPHSRAIALRVLQGAIRVFGNADSVLEDADPIRALIAQHAAILDQNESAYFELAYHRVTGWMAWITDKPLCMPPVVNPDRKVLAQGQGDTADEACADAARKQGAKHD